MLTSPTSTNMEKDGDHTSHVKDKVKALYWHATRYLKHFIHFLTNEMIINSFTNAHISTPRHRGKQDDLLRLTYNLYI